MSLNLTLSQEKNLYNLLEIHQEYLLKCSRIRRKIGNIYQNPICKNRKYVLAKRIMKRIQCNIDMILYKYITKESLDDYNFWKSVEYEDEPAELEDL